MSGQIVPLCDLVEGQEADFFALLSEKQELTTRDGKPYHRGAFRDAKRVVGCPIWADSSLAAACRDQWKAGQFYKLRAALSRSEKYGLQLEIRKIRPVEESDRQAGFDPRMCLPASRFDPHEMLAELRATADQRIADAPLRQLVLDILDAHAEPLLSLPAAKHHHHAFLSGWLEHVLNVTRTCSFLADQYARLYADLQPPLDTDVLIAAAVLHDIGKLRELAVGPGGAEYTAAGSLIGHVLQGRDIVREAAADRKIDPEKLLRLEHAIIAHQRLPEWGAPKPPMTPEALIVHYADDLDAKLQMMVAALADDTTEGPVTSRRNILSQQVYRGGV